MHVVGNTPQLRFTRFDLPNCKPASSRVCRPLDRSRSAQSQRQQAIMLAARLVTCAAPSVRPGAVQQRTRRRPATLHAATAEAVTQRLTKDDLVAYLASGCKPRDQWRCDDAGGVVGAGGGACRRVSHLCDAPCCSAPAAPASTSTNTPCMPTALPNWLTVHTSRIGTEHEKLGYNVADTRRLTYDQIAALLSRIQERFGWGPIIEAGNIIGLTQVGALVLEAAAARLGVAERWLGVGFLLLPGRSGEQRGGRLALSFSPNSCVKGTGQHGWRSGGRLDRIPIHACHRCHHLQFDPSCCLPCPAPTCMAGACCAAGRAECAAATTCSLTCPSCLPLVCCGAAGRAERDAAICVLPLHAC